MKKLVSLCLILILAISCNEGLLIPETEHDTEPVFIP